MNYNKTLSLFNGNDKRYTVDVPCIIILTKFSNDTAKAHFEKNTGLTLTPYSNGYKCQPKTFKQLTKIFVTYNFKTKYYNNYDYKNTLMLSFNK